MKKVISTFLFVVIATIVHSQATYYWVGGLTGTFTLLTNWNTALNGSGTSRSSNLNPDILIIDGTNVGGAVPTQGTIVPDNPGSTSFGQLKLQNNANVVLQRSTSGASTYTILGDGTSADDLTIDATSSLKITSSVTGYGFTVQLGNTTYNTATGKIFGTIRIDDGGLNSTCRLIDSSSIGSLVFTSGSNLYLYNRNSTSAYAFGTSSTPKSTNYSFKFQAGSNFIYQGTTKVYGTIASDYFLDFDKGSNVILEANPPNFFANHFFANVIVRNNQSITLDGNPYLIDTLTINSGSTLLIKSTGNTNLTGSLINNGTFGSAGAGGTSSALLLVGNTPQSIGGTGTFSAIGGVQIGADADVTLNTNLQLNGTATSSIVGKLNAQTYTITGLGTGTSMSPYNIRTPASVSTTGCNTSADGFSVTLPTTVYATGINTANAVAGVLVSGPDFQPNTYVIGTSSGTSTITISKPANTKGATGTITVTLSNNGGTLITSNTGGLDGTILPTLKRTFGSGTNYIFNAATTTPFSDSAYLNPMGNVTFNAAATTNRTQNISGVLTLNNGNLTVRPTDTLIFQSTGSIAGTGASKYIALQKNTTNVGAIKINGLAASTPKIFPVGSTTNYLPVTITPSSVDSFLVSVFEGATTNGMVSGSALSNKTDIVDAVWTINRTSLNTDASTITTAFVNALEGSGFTNFPNASVGISKHDGTNWTTAIGSGDNTTNTASASFSSFGSFAVGKLGVALPVSISTFSAIQEFGKIKLAWKVSTEINIANYTLEKSIDGIHFNSLFSVNANNNQNYTGYDFAPETLNYYRIKITDKNNSINYSNIVKIKTTATKAELVAYPNPVVNNQLTIQLSNATKGNSVLQLLNFMGQKIFTKNIVVEEGNQTQYIALPASISKGLYKLIVVNNEVALQQNLLIE